MSIYEMTSTPQKRDDLLSKSNQDKLEILYNLTDSIDFLDLLYFVEQAIEDAEYCKSYR